MVITIQNRMDESFLSTLLDSSGNVFLFGKTESLQRSIFLNPLPVKDPFNEINRVKYIQFYKGHELKPLHNEPQLRKNISPDWFFPLILIVLMVFAWLRMFYSKFFSQMIQAFMNKNLAKTTGFVEIRCFLSPKNLQDFPSN